MSKLNLWDKIANTPEEASMYMGTYGEGADAGTRTVLVSLINDGESVLDVGAGPAWNYERFRRDLPNVKYRGLDYSRVMVEGAKLKYPEADIEVGDVRDIPEADNSWDVVILQDVLEHTNGYEKPLEEALRVARKRIIVSFWHLAEMDDPHINDDGDDGWGAWYDKREWEKFLDSLNVYWLHDQIDFNNRARDYYVIDLERK